MLYCYSLSGTLKLTICSFCRSYLWRYSSCGGCNCCNRYYNLQNKVRFKQINQLVYDTKILNYLYVLLRREVMANTTSLTLWYLQALLNPTAFYWRNSTEPGKWPFMYLCVRVIYFASFCDFDIWYWNVDIEMFQKYIPKLNRWGDIYTWIDIHSIYCKPVLG